MNEAAIDELLAEQAAQSVVIATLMRALLKMAGQDGDARAAVLNRWEQAGHDLLARTPLRGLDEARRERVITMAQAKLTDIFITGH